LLDKSQLSQLADDQADESPETTPKNDNSNPSDLEDLKIGEFTLKDNEDNNFTERELKSIDVDKEWKLFKVLCLSCHINKLNVFNQISIMNISWFGSILGHENEYISGLKSINPSEAILMDRILNRHTSNYALPGPYQSFLNSNGHHSIFNRESSHELFDNKIAALKKAKNSAVEEENYTEAERFKQIIMKIGQLKTHVNSLENKKMVYASSENYESAKKIKNEVNRIRNIVLSVSAGGSLNKPKIIPPLKNAQTVAEKHNRRVNKSLFDASNSVKTKQSFENFRTAHKHASHSIFNIENKGDSTLDENEVNGFETQRSVINLKNSAQKKLAGILKYNTGVYHSNNMTMMPSKSTTGINSAADITMMNSERLKDQNEFYHRTNKKVRMDQPSFKRKGSNISRVSVDEENRQDLMYYEPKNADNRVVPGALMKNPIDFSKVIEDKNEQEEDLWTITAPDFDPSDKIKAQQYLQYFEENTVKNLFSKKWQNKEEGYRTLTKEMKNLITNPPDSTQVGDSCGHASSFKNNKLEWFKLVYSSVEKGLEDKIIHVKNGACDLYQALLQDTSEPPMQLKDLSNIIGVLVDWLSENNNKFKDKWEEILKQTIYHKHFDFVEPLSLIIAKQPNKNKAFTRFNHAKLNFLLDVIEDYDKTPSKSKNDTHSQIQFPSSPLLDFIEKMIVNREKIMTKYTREKIERAYVIAYQKSSYEVIKGHLDALDNIFLFNLSKQIPEIDTSSISKDITEDNHKEEVTIRRLAELRKQRLKSLKRKQSFNQHNQYANEEDDKKEKRDVPSDHSSRSKKSKALSLIPK